MTSDTTTDPTAPESSLAVCSGNERFDKLHALAVREAIQNSIHAVKHDAYNHGRPIAVEAFQTGAKWHSVWTRDLAYACHLALARFDPPRAGASLLFKTSGLKTGVEDGYANQIMQDTGSGGSYPVSTDRVVWALGAFEWLHYLDGGEREAMLRRIDPIIRGTVEQDRRLVFDPSDGLYRGEQSFLDWREQTYPPWTADSVLPIGTSKALGTNVAHFYILDRAAWLAETLGGDRDRDATRYREWASSLKTAIRERLYDEETGLHGAYILDDGGMQTRVNRRDLLGESLAILLGVTDSAAAARAIESYPAGPFGPPVVWPQERGVRIYHNCGIWPFVTAYWMLAAKRVGNAAAVSRAIQSLMDGAARHESNMEVLDFVSGKDRATSHGIKGPATTSPRQLWSVAGYLSLVHNVIFGLETAPDGIRFDPFIPADLRASLFGARATLSLRGLRYRNRTIEVAVRLPAAEDHRGVYRLARATLNGAPCPDGFVPAAELADFNRWELQLEHGPAASERIHEVDTTDARALFAPPPPRWAAEPIRAENGLLTIRFESDAGPSVTHRIYRNGACVASGVTASEWTDPDSADHAGETYFYAVASVDGDTGHTSHRTPSRYWRPEGAVTIVPARDLRHRGGLLIDEHHIADWGDPDDIVQTPEIRVSRTGRYRLRVRYANGSAPVITGITCAVKRLDVLESPSDDAAASGYAIMPVLGKDDWTRFEWSSSVTAHLNADRNYTVRLREDPVSRNMSYLEKNTLYTALPGGGPRPFNRAHIAAIELLHLGAG